MSLRNDGIYLLNVRISHFKDGRIPKEVPYWWEQYQRPGSSKWTVVRHQPKAPTWASSTHPLGTVRHLVRYQLIAHHVSGFKATITVWQCTRRCNSPITMDEAQMPKKKCWTCSKFS